jgi:hypothetical protein
MDHYRIWLIPSYVTNIYILISQDLKKNYTSSELAALLPWTTWARPHEVVSGPAREEEAAVGADATSGAGAGAGARTEVHRRGVASELAVQAIEEDEDVDMFLLLGAFRKNWKAGRRFLGLVLGGLIRCSIHL